MGRQVLLQQVAKLLRSSGLHPELGLQVRNDAILGSGLFTLRDTTRQHISHINTQAASSRPSTRHSAQMERLGDSGEKYFCL